MKIKINGIEYIVEKDNDKIIKAPPYFSGMEKICIMYL